MSDAVGSEAQIISFCCVGRAIIVSEPSVLPTACSKEQAGRHRRE